MKRKFPLFVLFLLSVAGFAAVLFFTSTDQSKPLAGQEKESKYSKGDIAYYFAQYELEKTRDPRTRALPENIREKELAFVSRIEDRDTYNSRMFHRGVLPQVQLLKWNQRGPSNVGGRMKIIVFDADNEKIVIAGSASGGVWRSTNQGVTWTRTSSPNQMQRVTSITQDRRPGKRNVWYYGTGELLSTTDRKISKVPRTIGLGNGIYKSTDNGLSWQVLPSTAEASPDKLSEVFQGVWDIAVDPANLNQDVVYAACYGAIMRSTDGGVSWSVALGDLANKSFCTDVAITSNGIVYAALSAYTSGSATGKPSKAGIWRSANGTDWTNITPNGFPDNFSGWDNFRVVRLALAPSNQNIMYVLAETPADPAKVDPPDWAWSVSAHYFWKYTDGTGNKWEDRTDNLPPAGIPAKIGDIQPQQYLQSLGGYALCLKVRPDDENTVLISGTTLFRSTSGFADTLHSAWMGGYPFNMEMTMLHPDIHYFEFLPSNNSVLYVASDGGLQRTNNISDLVPSWDNLNNALVTSQFYSVAIDRSTAGDPFIIGGLQDNFTQFTSSEDFSKPWQPVIGGDGISCAVPNGKPYVLGSWYNGAVVSLVFDEKYNVIKDIYQTPQILPGESFEFFTIFALDQNNKTFYLPARDKLWRKDDMLASSQNRELVNSGWSELTNAAVETGTYISAITSVTATINPTSRLYYGTNDGKVYRIDNATKGNPQKIDITGEDFPKGAFVTCIEADTRNSDNLFAVFSNYNVQSIFYSTDGGASWSAQGGNLEENPDGGGAGPSIRWIKMLHVGDRTIYFAGTSAGLYSTLELAGTETEWFKEGANTIGNAIIDMIDVRESDGLVVVATQGSGVFSTYVKELSADTSQETDDFSLSQNYPNPAGLGSTVDFVVPFAMPVNLRITDNTGRQAALVTKVALPGSNSIFVNTGAFASGAYFYTLETPMGKLTKKMVVAR